MKRKHMFRYSSYKNFKGTNLTKMALREESKKEPKGFYGAPQKALLFCRDFKLYNISANI